MNLFPLEKIPLRTWKMVEEKGGVPSPSSRPISDAEKMELVREKIRTYSANAFVYFPIQLGKVLTLADLRAAAGDRLQGELIDYLGIKKNIDKLQKYFSFFVQLQKVGDPVLEKISLQGLYCCDPSEEYSDVKIALMEAEKVLSMPIRKLRSSHGEVFALRLAQLYREPSNVVNNIAVSKHNPEQWPAAHLSFLDVALIQKAAHQLPLAAFGLLSEEQLRKIDFSYLSPSQVLRCLTGYLTDSASLEKRVAVVSKKQIFQMDNQKITAVFFGKLEPNFQKKVIALFSPEIIEEMLHRELFSVLPFITVEQLSHIHFEDVSQEAVDAFFPPLNPALFLPGWNYLVSEVNNRRKYIYFSRCGTDSQEFSAKIITQKMEERRGACRSNFSAITPAQFELIKEMVDPGVLRFLNSERGPSSGILTKKVDR